MNSRRSLAFAAAIAVCVAAMLAGQARAAHTSTWYWTPGACKSELQQYGVQIGDNRVFHVQKAYCVGLHNHCWLDKSLRRYKVFITVMRSQDGVVRSMQLTVTGHQTWTGAKLKLISRSMSATAFANGYGPAAWTVAKVENQGGCFDIHP